MCACDDQHGIETSGQSSLRHDAHEGSPAPVKQLLGLTVARGCARRKDDACDGFEGLKRCGGVQRADDNGVEGRQEQVGELSTQGL